MLSALPTAPPTGPLLNEKDQVFHTYAEVESNSSSSTYLPLNPPVDVEVAPAEIESPIVDVDIPLSGATKLRKMLEETNELIVCPGVYDGLTARTAIEVGFSAMYMVSTLHYHFRKNFLELIS